MILVILVNKLILFNLVILVFLVIFRNLLILVTLVILVNLVNWVILVIPRNLVILVILVILMKLVILVNLTKLVQSVTNIFEYSNILVTNIYSNIRLYQFFFYDPLNHTNHSYFTEELEQSRRPKLNSG